MSKYYKSKSIKIESTGKKIELLIFQPTLNAKPKEKNSRDFMDSRRRLRNGYGKNDLYVTSH